jgi:hypothetical protein
MANEPDNALVFKIQGDASEYKKMTDEVEKDTKDMTEKVARDTTIMVEKVVKDTQTAAKAMGTVAASRKTSLSDDLLSIQFQKEAKLRQDATGRIANYITLMEKAAARPTVGGRIAWMQEAAYGITQLTARAQQLAEITGTAEKFAGLRTIMMGASHAHTALSVAGMATAGAGAGEAGAGAAAAGFSATAAAAGVAAAAVATFTGAVYATTYAISGSKGVMQVHNNLLEGSKYILYGVTLGYVDYTAKTEAAKEGQAAFASQQASNTQRIADAFAMRTKWTVNLYQEIDKLEDHSLKAEIAMSKLLGEEGNKSGIKANAQEELQSRLAQRFQQFRVADIIKDLQEKAGKAGKTEDQLTLDLASQNNATAAQVKQIEVLQQTIKAREDEKKKTEEAERAKAEAIKRTAEEAKQAAKKVEDDAKRAKAKVIEDGKQLHDSLMTPIEKATAELSRVNDLFKAGAVSAEDLRRATEKYASDVISAEGGKSLTLNRSAGIQGMLAGSAEHVASMEEFTQDAKQRKLGMAGRFAQTGEGGLKLGLQSGGKDDPATKLLNSVVAELRTIAANTNNNGLLVIKPANLKR